MKSDLGCMNGILMAARRGPSVVTTQKLSRLSRVWQTGWQLRVKMQTRLSSESAACSAPVICTLPARWHTAVHHYNVGKAVLQGGRCLYYQTWKHGLCCLKAVFQAAHCSLVNRKDTACMHVLCSQLMIDCFDLPWEVEMCSRMMCTGLQTSCNDCALAFVRIHCCQPRLGGHWVLDGRYSMYGP